MIAEPTPRTQTTINCLNGQCRRRLGVIAMTVVERREARAVWRIEPGWRFHLSGNLRGVLDFSDYELQSEQRLSHEILGQRKAPTGATVNREADLPICVRCPDCHRLRMVLPEAFFRSD